MPSAAAETYSIGRRSASWPRSRQLGRAQFQSGLQAKVRFQRCAKSALRRRVRAPTFLGSDRCVRVLGSGKTAASSFWPRHRMIGQGRALSAAARHTTALHSSARGPCRGHGTLFSLLTAGALVLRTVVDLCVARMDERDLHRTGHVGVERMRASRILVGRPLEKLGQAMCPSRVS